MTLERLDLRETGLSSLPARVFDGLAALDTLGLGNNQLMSLPVGVFSGLHISTDTGTYPRTRR